MPLIRFLVYLLKCICKFTYFRHISLCHVVCQVMIPVCTIFLFHSRKPTRIVFFILVYKLGMKSLKQEKKTKGRFRNSQRTLKLNCMHNLNILSAIFVQCIIVHSSLGAQKSYYVCIQQIIFCRCSSWEKFFMFISPPHIRSNLKHAPFSIRTTGWLREKHPAIRWRMTQQ